MVRPGPKAGWLGAPGLPSAPLQTGGPGCWNCSKGEGHEVSVSFGLRWRGRR
jgi:hypothetical protein